jgi:hypothetical protein
MPSVKDTGHIDAVLDRFGLNGFDWATATAAGGRNDNWFGGTTTGRQVFVKIMAGSEAEVDHGMRRTEAFYQTRSESEPQNALRTTVLIGQDRDAAVQVFDCLEGARDGRQAALDGTFDSALAAKAGAAIGALHSVPSTKLISLENSLPPLPRQNMLPGLTADMFYDASFAQLEAWRLLQQDRTIVDSVARMERASAEGVQVPIHGDLCLDQFLITKDELYLIDWEMFQLGDPARDLGAFVGEWLHHAVVHFLAERAKSGSGRPMAAPNIALTPTWRPWCRSRPMVEAFWLAYRSAQPMISAVLAPRVVLFACWHLLLRVLTDAHFRPRLDGTGHTMVRLARTILVNPERFITVLGLGD